jgi:hypothetical protein
MYDGFGIAALNQLKRHCPLLLEADIKGNSDRMVFDGICIVASYQLKRHCPLLLEVDIKGY